VAGLVILAMGLVVANEYHCTLSHAVTHYILSLHERGYNDIHWPLLNPLPKSPALPLYKDPKNPQQNTDLRVKQNQFLILFGKLAVRKQA
jgi:hypothetical protein